MSNPELMRSMMQSDPVTAQLMKQHPEMEYVLSNPSMMRSMLSPDMMEMASGMMQRMRALPTSSTMSGTPGSFPMPGSATPEEKKQPTESTAPQNPNPMANLWGMYGMPNMRPNMPFMYPPVMPGYPYNPFMAQMMEAMTRPPAVPTAPAAPTSATVPSAPSAGAAVESLIDYKKKYAAELLRMKETNGDVFEAIEKVSNMK